MFTVITAAVLVGKPFYPECRHVPAIEICVDEFARDPESRRRSLVVLSELRFSDRMGEKGFIVNRMGKVGVARRQLGTPPGAPAIRYGRNGPWRDLPAGTFCCQGSFTWTIAALIEWELWRAHCDEIRNDERRSYDGSWRSFPPEPNCWTPKGFDKNAYRREVGVIEEAVVTGGNEP